MSERKSAEIKFRCTPSFKSGALAAASAAGQSLTEFIESAVWAQQNAKLDSATLVDNAIETLKIEVCPLGDACLGHGPSCFDAAASLEDDETPVIPNRDDQFPVCSCRPWEYCTHKAT